MAPVVKEGFKKSGNIFAFRDCFNYKMVTSVRWQALNKLKSVLQDFMKEGKSGRRLYTVCAQCFRHRLVCFDSDISQTTSLTMHMSLMLLEHIRRCLISIYYSKKFISLHHSRKHITNHNKCMFVVVYLPYLNIQSCYLIFKSSGSQVLLKNI